jgi:hypothetical protein
MLLSSDSRLSRQGCYPIVTVGFDARVVVAAGTSLGFCLGVSISLSLGLGY